MRRVKREYHYLDTNYLLAYLARRYRDFLKGADFYIDEDQIRQANSVISYLNPSKIKVPVFVLAELVMQLKEKNVNVGIDVLFGDFEIAMLRMEDFNNFIKALKMLIKDEWLEEMDSIIVAHAISSSECKSLLTFDKNLISSKTINDTNKVINGSEGILITSDPRLFSK